MKGLFYVHKMQMTGHDSHPTISPCALGIYSYLFNRMISNVKYRSVKQHPVVVDFICALKLNALWFQDMLWWLKTLFPSMYLLWLPWSHGYRGKVKQLSTSPTERDSCAPLSPPSPSSPLGVSAASFDRRAAIYCV